MKVMENLSEEDLKSIGFEFCTYTLRGELLKKYSLYARRGIVIGIPNSDRENVTIVESCNYIGPVFEGKITNLSELKSKLKELNISYDGDN